MHPRSGWRWAHTLRRSFVCCLLYRRVDEHGTLLWSRRSDRIPRWTSLDCKPFLCRSIGRCLTTLMVQYWLGPTLGSLLGAGIYSLLVQYVCFPPIPRYSESNPPYSHQYWLLNPNQDTDNPHHSPDDPVVRAKAAVSGQQIERHEAEGQGPRNSLNTNNDQNPAITGSTSGPAVNGGYDRREKGGSPV